MSESPSTPQAGIAGALTDLSEQTRILVRQEIEAAEREVWQKMKSAAPGAGLAGAGSVFALFALASSYRVLIKLLEKWLPPAAAAFLATAGYGAAAGSCAVAGFRRLHAAPVPFPTDTVRDASAAIRETAAEAGS